MDSTSDHSRAATAEALAPRPPIDGGPTSPIVVPPVHPGGTTPAPAPTPARVVNRLTAGQQLNVGDRMVPGDGKVFLVLQADGNLVLYRSDNGCALWSSRTFGRPVTHAIMQGDGNFVCYDNSGHAYWATGTDGHPGSSLVMQDDGNLVLYGPNNVPLWASNTVRDWSPMSYETENQHLGTGEWMNSTASMAVNGLISGRTRIWCTMELRGFHGSVFPVLLDANQRAIWPPNPQVAKHQYGVDGTWVGTSDRTVYWANQVDAATAAQAKSLALIQFLDPKNMLLTDLGILGKAIGDIAAMIIAFEGL